MWWYVFPEGFAKLANFRLPIGGCSARRGPVACAGRAGADRGRRRGRGGAVPWGAVCSLGIAAGTLRVCVWVTRAPAIALFQCPCLVRLGWGAEPAVCGGPGLPVSQRGPLVIPALPGAAPRDGWEPMAPGAAARLSHAEGRCCGAEWSRCRAAECRQGIAGPRALRDVRGTAAPLAPSPAFFCSVFPRRGSERFLRWYSCSLSPPLAQMAFRNHSKGANYSQSPFSCWGVRLRGVDSNLPAIATSGCKLPLHLFLMKGGEGRNSLPITRVLFPSDFSSQVGLSLRVWHGRLGPRNLECYSSFQSLLIPQYLQNKHPPCLHLPFASAALRCAGHQCLAHVLWPVHCPAKSRSPEVALRKSDSSVSLAF